jgi:hypothetical protein
MANENSAPAEEHRIRQQIKECLVSLRKAEDENASGIWVVVPWLLVTFFLIARGLGFWMVVVGSLVMLVMIVGTVEHFAKQRKTRMADQAALRFDELFPSADARREQAIAVLRQMAGNEEGSYNQSAKKLLVELGLVTLPTEAAEEQLADVTNPASSHSTATGRSALNAESAEGPSRERIAPAGPAAEKSQGRRKIPLEPEDFNNP